LQKTPKGLNILKFNLSERFKDFFFIIKRFTFQSASSNCLLFVDCPALDETCDDCISGEKVCQEEGSGQDLDLFTFLFVCLLFVEESSGQSSDLFTLFCLFVCLFVDEDIGLSFD
jgi:hypothetical protein